MHLLDLVLQGLSIFNNKIKLGVVGRKKTFSILKENLKKTDKTIWMHCASLGEFEQGLPVLKALKTKYPSYKFVVSFFSPSGYEHKKHTPDADVVVYLPIDTPHHAKRFLDSVNPELILFVKYEIWTNFLLEAKKRKLKLLLISATFRKNQIYFRWYGSLMRKVLFSFDHIFTQDEKSKSLIQNLGYNTVTVSGDTRFDRVSDQLKMNNSVEFIKTFKNDKTCIVFGSTWPADDSLFIPFINKSSAYKFIIAPHHIKPSYIESLKKQLHAKTVCFSEMEGKNLSEYQVFILDTIGYLSKVYSYADIAYVGGGAGATGLHNILEPAVFGIPIVIGKNYSKFPEAKALVNLKGIHSVKNVFEFEKHLLELLENKNKRKEQGAINLNFIKNNRGAVIQILDYVRI